MRDFSAIHEGFKNYLKADATLMTLAPGGIWLKEAPQAARGVFVIWRVQATEQDLTHDRGGYDKVVYSVMAATQDSNPAGALAAARRMNELLTGARFPVDGYQVVRCELWPDGPDINEVDLDGDRRWQYRGAVWDVWVSPQ